MDEGDSLTAGNTISTATTASSSLSTSSSMNNNNARRRPHYFFRTADSSIADEEPTPRLEGTSPLSEGFRLLLWSLGLNGVVALLVLGLVEAIVLPVLMAILELTASPRMTKLLTVLLTAVLFQGGVQGSMVLLLAVGGAALGLVMAQWDDGFVPLFIFLFVGMWTFLRVGSLGGSGDGGGGGLLGSLGSGPPASAASSALKAISEVGSARGERSWRWRGLWGA